MVGFSIFAEARCDRMEEHSSFSSGFNNTAEGFTIGSSDSSIWSSARAAALVGGWVGVDWRAAYLGNGLSWRCLLAWNLLAPGRSQVVVKEPLIQLLRLGEKFLTSGQRGQSRYFRDHAGLLWLLQAVGGLLALVG